MRGHRVIRLGDWGRGYRGDGGGGARDPHLINTCNRQERGRQMTPCLPWESRSSLLRDCLY